MYDWSLGRWLSGKQRDTSDVVVLSHVLPIPPLVIRGRSGRLREVCAFQANTGNLWTLDPDEGEVWVLLATMRQLYLLPLIAASLPLAL